MPASTGSTRVNSTPFVQSGLPGNYPVMALNYSKVDFDLFKAVSRGGRR
jgi:hypothetical protein